MRGKEQLPEPGSHTGVSEPIRADQNFDLNVLNDFILNELQEGEITELHPCDFTNIQIGEIRDQLMDQIPGWAVAPTELMDSPPLVTRAVALPQLVGRGTAPPQLVSRGVAPPQLIDRGVAPPQLVSRGTGPPQLASRGTGPPQLASRGTGPPQLVSRGTGAPQLVSRGTGSPQVAGKDAGPPDARRKTTTATGRGGRAMATSRLVSRNFTRPFLNVSVKGEPPKLVITEQPKQRGMRFRYECEGRSAGSIPGENTTENNKTLPTIQIQNWQGEVKVVISLVTKGDPYKPHPHSLVGKDCHDGICEVVVSPKCNMKASFANLGIQCMKKKEVGKAVEQRLKLGIDPFNVGDSARCPDDVDMNVVRLCFQAFIQEPSVTLTPVLSDPIYDKKATNTSELRICRLNKDCGVCRGGEELFLLCDKVQKEDIAVVFSEGNWEAKGVFSQTDVHRQIAIVFKSPPYCDIDIQQPVMVQLRLFRPSDKEYSDSFEFRYLPSLNDAYGVRLKSKRSFRFPPINTFMDSSYTAPNALPQLKQAIDNRDFQFSANAEAVQTFTKKEGEEFAELFTWGQGSKPWSCFGREYAAAATCYRDGPFAGLQDGGLYGDPCYLKDEPADASGYGGFYGQAVEAGGDCREAEALRPALDVAYSALMAVDNLGAVPSEDDEEDLTDYVFNMGFAGGGGGGEALSAILGSSIALPSDQAGSKG